MGLDPEFPNYEAGVDCAVCKSVIFNEVTPKYIEANVQGVLPCPTPPLVFTNGVYQLPQTAPCLWNLILPGLINVAYQLNIGSSTFSVTAPPFIFFVEQIFVNCQTSFTNTAVCGVGGAIASGGTAEVFWGPTIDPEP